MITWDGKAILKMGAVFAYNHMSTLKQRLVLFVRNSMELLRHFITVDMCSLKHTRDQVALETMGFPGELAPKKVKDSANKFMATLYWETRDVNHIDYLQNQITVNNEYYENFFEPLNDDLKKKWSHFTEKKVFIHRNNARSTHP